MKKYLVVVSILCIICFQNLDANDIFESKISRKKLVNKVASFQKLNGEIVEFSDVRNEMYKLSDNNLEVEKPKVNYIYHRLNKTHYKSSDLKKWELMSQNELKPKEVFELQKPILIIYPKIVDDFVEYDAPNGQEYSVYSAYGYKVDDGKVKDGVIDLSRLSAGLYLIQINNSIIKINKL